MLKNMKLEELEILSYADLTELILKEENKTFTTPQLFKKICDLLGYNDDEYTNKIGDYYTSLSTDKRFVFLDNNEWDLREKTPVAIVMDEDDDEEVLDEDNEEDESIEDEYEDDIDVAIDDDELDEDDNLDNLAVLSDEELEDN